MSSAPARTAKARRSREQAREQIVAAASELVRERSYAELSVGELMDRAGIGRTLFYRYFDDLGDLLRRAGREPIEELFAAELALGESDAGPFESIRSAIAAAVTVYRRHGPILRAIAEGAVSDERIATGQETFRRRFDELVARTLESIGGGDAMETARALNLMNTAYLLDAYGREPRVSEETAVETLTAIWLAAMRERET